MDKQVLKLGACILENLPEMSSEVIQGWIDNRKGLQEYLRGLAPPKKYEGAFVGVAPMSIYAREFFKDRDGLRTTRNWNAIIMPDVSVGKLSTPPTHVYSIDVPEEINEEQIQSRLPNGYLFEGTDTFVCMLAALISTQSTGEKGVLLTNGYANVFYVKVRRVFSVHVYWPPSLKEWQLHVGDPSREMSLRAGVRIFAYAEE